MRLKWVSAITLILLLSAVWAVSHAQTAADEGEEDLGGEEEEDTGTGGGRVDPANPVALQLLSQALLSRFSNFSAYIGPDIKKHLGFCIRDV